MPAIRLTKEFRFEMAHVLEGYDGPCRNIHGHSYKLKVTVIGNPISQPGHPKLGMVIDFGDLKQVVETLITSRFDHSIAVLENSNIHRKLAGSDLEKVEALPFQPTCENMVEYFARLLAPSLPEGVSLHHLLLHETATSYAEWYADDNP
ncbi:MAG TPA: 6-carboxytetrahydropterin synthase [Tenuifilaceae bacterium]|jgi:6-pyruvoyltetrahydropterin/6-carboxytetrahydropterin synthase|nr:6-carboxytetrahydropterin synthase [Bacteroidales bacterium]HNT42086.1 6-carboxytetrahydropterin synthase [Tenuifilaceae bacterium]MBP8644283.1 6-carboxytetrahydropterin synthase [Bacteroidales bacterium]NLI88277.1 6-carboxytetrahydropterin synthase [Bacteroidales bacterium]HNY08939.1 6-carboxytetrahydropterin synthase [Tenuifilaceae bacterium]